MKGKRMPASTGQNAEGGKWVATEDSVGDSVLSTVARRCTSKGFTALKVVATPGRNCDIKVAS